MTTPTKLTPEQETAMIQSAYDRLLQGYRHYEQKGYADYDDKKNMENMYSAYHGLGENGVMDDMQEKFKQLPEHL